jgi:hypothetical protein
MRTSDRLDSEELRSTRSGGVLDEAAVLVGARLDGAVHPGHDVRAVDPASPRLVFGRFDRAQAHETSAKQHGDAFHAARIPFPPQHDRRKP